MSFSAIFKPKCVLMSKTSESMTTADEPSTPHMVSFHGHGAGSALNVMFGRWKVFRQTAGSEELF